MFDILKFFTLNLFRWRHLANSSDRLFNILSQSDLTNDSFSSRQRLHLEPPAAREGTRLIMEHLMVNFSLALFEFQCIFGDLCFSGIPNVVQRFLVVCKTFLKCAHCHTNIFLRLSNVSRSNFSFINNAFCQAFSIKRAFISCMAITVFVSRWFVPFL